MPIFGYIMVHSLHPTLNEDREWMKNYGCQEIVEERSEFERIRPKWKALLKSLEMGDTLVVSKMSNVVENTSDLAFFWDFCRREGVRVISINDELDSSDKLFPPKSTKAFMDVVASIPAEVHAIKNSSRRVAKIRRVSGNEPGKIVDKSTRNRKIVNLYKSGLPIDEIWKMSGFKSRSSVFRILKESGVEVDRNVSRTRKSEAK